LEQAGQKLIDRAYIINLMKTDPDGYAALSAEISKAYGEKRFRAKDRINPRTGKVFYYKDNPETKKAENALQMYVDGKYVSKSHPLHKPGRYKGFTDAAFSSLENYETAKQGQVYVLVNPAFPGWCKVGMAVDSEDRLKQYQTSSPYRDYELIKAYDTDDRREAEKAAHELLAQSHARKGEWFYIQHPVATEILDGHFNEDN